jgi:FlaA1/EpsC-like NDP-sugar epimerase
VQRASSASSPDWARLLGRAISGTAAPSLAAAAGRRVLVTGAGGFIGSEMVRILAASGARQIVLLEIAEEKLFAISEEMTGRGFGHLCSPVLGSVCDRGLLAELFAHHRPDLVLHAAALKHVPLMERNPFAAVETNSLGTWALAEAALAHYARQMILISTDKAVEPHSIMGASKRIAELIMLARPRAGAALRSSVVRLANVIGSPCSVAPLFAEQIDRGGPLTITDPRARRYFLSLSEVVQLLGQVIAMEPAGILVPDPGPPVPIRDLARRMMAAAGRQLPVAITGLRPGDKMDESLISTAERYEGQATPGLRRVVSSGPADLRAGIEQLSAALAARDQAQMLRIVQELVPNYQPSDLLRRGMPEAAPAQS